MQYRSRRRGLRFETLESRRTPALVIDLGTIDLLPDTAGQVVELRVAGTDPANDPPVTGVNLLAQIGDGRGPLVEPVFSAVEFSGGIWEAFPVTTTGGVVEDAPQFVQAGVVFSQTGQSVTADGIVGRLTVSTLGIDQGTFAFQLTNAEVGEDSHFVGSGGVALPITLIPGQLRVLPPNHPPSAILLSNNGVEEFLAGEVVGLVTVEDPDPGDTHELTVSDDRFEIIAGVLKLKDDKFLQHALSAQVPLRITAQDSGTPPKSFFVDVPLDVLANPFPWQNSRDRLDVNRDGLVAPNDILILINDLNARGARSLPVPPVLPLAPPPFIDVSGDNLVAPGDALLIVNFLNSRGGEGEANAVDAWFLAEGDWRHLSSTLCDAAILSAQDKLWATNPA
jgi:hypothetical protein